MREPRRPQRTLPDRQEDDSGLVQDVRYVRAMAEVRVTPSALHDHASRLQRVGSDVLGATGSAHAAAVEGARSTGHPGADARAASFWATASQSLVVLGNTTAHVGDRLHLAADGYAGADEMSAAEMRRT